MYKMIAIDLDDTLLNDCHEVSKEDKEALFKAQKEGVKLCMMTGRNYLSTKPFLEMAAFEDLTGCLNGAYIVDSVTDNFLYQYSINSNVCSEILKYIEKTGVHVNFYHDHEVVSREKNHITDYYRDLTGIEPEPVGKLSEYVLDTNVSAGKLLLIDENEKLKQIQKVLEEKYHEVVHLTFSKPRHLEINSICASKGNAVKVIAEHYHIAREEIIAIGNDENDITMIRNAGLGIAMGNAKEKIKKEADYVTLSNNESGVAYAINKFILKEQKDREEK